MELSIQQQEIIRWVLTGRGSLNIVARAGCGKTTMLIKIVEAIAEASLGNVFLGAYNKAIASEIAARLKLLGIDWKQAESSTMHAIGFRLWRKAHPDVVVDEKKVFNLIEAQAETSSLYRVHAAQISKAVSLAKQSLFNEKTPAAVWAELFDYHGIDLDANGDIEEVIGASMAILLQSKEQCDKAIDFDDMIYAPLIHNVPCRFPYDFVLIDEAQDTNTARRALALKLLRPRTGRLIAVGDDRQAIYGFTGADSDAMSLIREKMDSAELPLNTTYRCPKAIVAAAQAIVPDIVADASAPEGSVTQAENTPDVVFRPDDVILCRNTAPLLEMAYGLIGRKIPCRVEGRDIGKQLEKLARRWKVKTLAALRNKLDDYLGRERAKWAAKGREDKVASAEDRVASLIALADVCTAENKQDVQDLCNLIQAMFQDSGATAPKILTLSTIHKSKGREWPRVFILRAKEFMPSRWATKPWQQLQEQNLSYVAMTRAQRELVYLG